MQYLAPPGVEDHDRVQRYLLPALAGSGCGSARVLVVPRPRKMVTSPSKSTSSKRAPVREKSASAKCSRRGGGAMPRTTRSRRPEKRRASLHLLPALAGSGCGSARVLVVPRPRKSVTGPHTSSKRAPVREKSASAKCSRRGGGCNTSHHQESKTDESEIGAFRHLRRIATYLLPALAGSGCGSARVLVVPRPRKMSNIPTSSTRACPREERFGEVLSKRGRGDASHHQE